MRLITPSPPPPTGKRECGETCLVCNSTSFQSSKTTGHTYPWRESGVITLGLWCLGDLSNHTRTQAQA
uniref:Uncharacterized protein n=1 Tax=Anguilla anguilla TaxID=7936 RepID=A0A0E9RU18_ANGAN